MFWKLALSATVLAFHANWAFAQTIDYSQLVGRANSLLEKLVNAKPISGCEQEAAQIIADRLTELNLPYEVILSGTAPATPPPPVTDPGGKCLDGRQPTVDKRPNLVVRLKATNTEKNLKALMVVAHIDVVPAIKQNWTPGFEAHKMVESEGYLYGRGVMDMLSYLSLSVEFLGELKKQNMPLERDLILMLNSDEEKGGANGMGWLVVNRPDLFQNVELALSEGGATIADDEQKPLFIGYEAAQKRYQDFKITATGETGHSSTPAKLQAVVLLTEALEKIRQAPPLPRLIPLIKSYFKERAKVETNQELKTILTKLGNASDAESNNLYPKFTKEVQTLEAKYPVLHALLRRTCTTTVMEAGNTSAKNAQPQTATAYINCRLMPDETVDEVLLKFKSRVNKSFGTKETDPKVSIDLDIDFRSTHGGASDINGVIPKTLAKYAANYFHGIPVIPSMLTGATDLRYLRKLGIHAYGFGPVIIADSDRKRSHGVDERIYAQNLSAGIEVFGNLILDVAAPTTRQPASLKKYPGEVSKNFKHAFESEHFNQDCSH